MLLLVIHFGSRLLFPTLDIELVASDASHPVAAEFTIVNPSQLIAVRNVLWYCMMTPLGTDRQIPILDLHQFQLGRLGTEISALGTERHACREKAPLRQDGTFDVSILLQYEFVLEAMSLKRVFTRSIERRCLTWRIEHGEGRRLD